MLRHGSNTAVAIQAGGDRLCRTLSTPLRLDSPVARACAVTRAGRQSPGRRPRYSRGTGRCISVPIGAADCSASVSPRVQALWLCVSHRDDGPDCHGKEGVAGSSPAEGFGNRATARFSPLRSESADPFRAVPNEKWSSVAAGGHCAAVGGSAEQLPLSAKVPRRYTLGASFLLRPSTKRSAKCSTLSSPVRPGEPEERVTRGR
jgi:hypothetical protein